MSDISYQVHYMDDNSDMKCLNHNFYDESEAQDAVTDLINQGVLSAYYDSIDIQHLSSTSSLIKLCTLVIEK